MVKLEWIKVRKVTGEVLGSCSRRGGRQFSDLIRKAPNWWFSKAYGKAILESLEISHWWSQSAAVKWVVLKPWSHQESHTCPHNLSPPPPASQQPLSLAIWNQDPGCVLLSLSSALQPREVGVMPSGQWTILAQAKKPDWVTSLNILFSFSLPSTLSPSSFLCRSLSSSSSSSFMFLSFYYSSSPSSSCFFNFISVFYLVFFVF